MADQTESAVPTKYVRVLRIVPNLAPKLQGRQPWLALGWPYVESGGDVTNNDTSVPSLGGEQGLYQLSADERRATGFTDSARILSDVDYSIDAGLALMDYYGGKVAAAGVTSDNEPLYSYLIKFAHGIGSGAMGQIVRAFVQQMGRQPDSIDEFKQFALDNPYRSVDHTALWLDNTDRVRSNGLALAALANIASPGIAPAGLLLLGGIAGLIGWGLWRAYR